MIRRPPRSTQSRSSAASDVYKRQGKVDIGKMIPICKETLHLIPDKFHGTEEIKTIWEYCPVSYTHLRAHETVLDLVCRLLLEKKKKKKAKEKNISVEELLDGKRKIRRR